MGGWERLQHSVCQNNINNKFTTPLSRPSVKRPSGGRRLPGPAILVHRMDPSLTCRPFQEHPWPLHAQPSHSPSSPAYPEEGRGQDPGPVSEADPSPTSGLEGLPLLFQCTFPILALCSQQSQREQVKSLLLEFKGCFGGK